MAEGRARSEWGHTAAVLAMIHNVNAAKPKPIEDFNPFAEKKSVKRDVIEMSVSELHALMTRKNHAKR